MSLDVQLVSYVVYKSYTLHQMQGCMLLRNLRHVIEIKEYVFYKNP